MIGIQLDGDTDFLETFPDTSISLKLENPILGTAEKLSPGSFSMPFGLPGGDSSPKNSAKLKHPDVIENNEAYQLQKAKLFLAGVPFRSGNLKSNSLDTKRIQSYFTFGLNSIANMKDVKLRDVINEVVTIDDSDIEPFVYLKYIGSGDSTIEINGQAYTVDSTADLLFLINDYYATHAVPGNGVWLPKAELGGGGDTPGGITPLYIKVRLAQSNGFDDVYATDPHTPLYVKVDEDQRANWQIEAFDMTAYYAPFAAFYDDVLDENKLRLPVRFNAKLHGSDTVKQSEIINGVEVGGVTVNNANWGLQNGEMFAVRNYNSLQPFLLLKWVFDKIAEEFSFAYEGDFYEHAEFGELQLDNTYTLDLVQEFIGHVKYIFWRRSFNISELVPDITVIDFFKGIASRYNLGIYYNEVSGKVSVVRREPIAKAQAYEDVTPICTPIENIQDDRKTGYTIRVEKESSDSFSQEESFVYGTSDVEYKITCGRLHSTKVAIHNGGQVSGPYVSQKHEDRFGLRVFHYKGIVDNGTYNYQSAAIDGDIIGEALTGIFETGLYYDFHRYWLLFESRRVTVKLKAHFPLRRLLRFDWALKRRYNRINYLIKSIDVQVSNKGLKVTGTELITMR